LSNDEFDLRVPVTAETGALYDGVDYVARARALRDELERGAVDADATTSLAPNIVKQLIEGGFYRLTVPRSFGGAQIGLYTFMQTIEAIAMADASPAWCLGQAAGCAFSAAYLQTDAAMEIFGDERAAVSWGPGSAKAVATDGGFRVTGKWSFASGIHQTTWVGGHSPVFDRDGVTPLLNKHGEPLVMTFFFPKDKVKITRVWNVIGLRGTGSDNYEVDDLFVPNRHCYWRDPTELKDNGPLYLFPVNTIHAVAFSAIALGIARTQLSSFIDLARVKTPRLQKNPIKLKDSHVIQGQVGMAEAQLRAARHYAFDSVERVWLDVEETGRVTLDQRMLIRLATTHAIHQAREVVDFAYHEAGALAVLASNPFERRFRDMHTITQQVQARRQHFETVGRHILGLEPDLTMV